jgi:hypothetical protein
MKIRLAAEYECHPMWAAESEGGLSNLDPDEFPLSAELVGDIRAWAAKYEATYNRNDPASSDFGSRSEEEHFDLEGRRLWKRLQAELGAEHDVAYFSVITGWEGNR